MKLRPYQTQAIEAVLSSLKAHRKVGAVLPTGAGKSLIETAIIDSMVDELSFNQVVLVVCHLTDVVDQLNLTYCQHGKHGKSAIRFSHRVKPRMGTKVVFATIQSLVSSSAREYWTKNPMRKEVVSVLIDEAHMFGTDSYETLESDLFPYARYVGFSATPYRKNQYSFSQFDTVAYAIDTQTLIKDGFLTPPKLFAMTLQNMEPAERFASVVRIWQEKEKDRGLVSVVYLRTKQEAQEMLLVAEEARIKAQFISGDSSETSCRALFESARKGEVEMIINVRKLETGIDIPNIGAVFMPYGTGSVVTYLQRIGRALRPFAGKQEAHVYVFGDAPSIASGKWQRIQRDALTARDPLDPLQTLENDLIELIEDGAPASRIAWTQDAIRACQILIDGKLKSIAHLIAEKKFPDKYNKAIRDLAPIMNASHAVAGDSSLTEAQIAVLTKKHRFKGEHISQLSQSEGAAILKALDTYFARSPWVLPNGPFAGRHVGETPPIYRRHMKDPANRSVWERWMRAGRPDPKESA